MRGTFGRILVAALVAAAGVLVAPGLAGAGPPTVQITINKVVVGTDPGIAFPITLTCDSQDAVTGTDFQIPNNGEQSEVVNLRHGESTVVNVELPPSEPEIATCRVTEDLSGTTLPAGISCAPSVTPAEVVVYDDTGAHSGEFTVTNTCTAAAPTAVVAAPTTTG